MYKVFSKDVHVGLPQKQTLQTVPIQPSTICYAKQLVCFELTRAFLHMREFILLRFQAASKNQ